MISLDTLLREFKDPRYQPYRIGPHLFEQVIQQARKVVSATPYSIYQTFNDGVAWNEDEWASLASEVITEFLIAQNQLDYVMRAHTIGAFKYRINQQIMRCLSARRPKTEIDNLLDRVSRFDFWEYNPRGEELLDQTIDQISQSLRDIKPDYAAEKIEGRERASKVFNKAQLEEILRRIINADLERSPAGQSVSKADLRRIFQMVLTDWTIKPLIRDEDRLQALKSEPSISSVLETEMRALMQKAIEKLNDYEVQLLKRVFIDGTNHSQVAKEVGKTRQTVASNMRGLLERLQGEINDVGSDSEREHLLKLFAEELQLKYVEVMGQDNGL